MQLTKNEKKILKLLLDNSKLSDTAIANKIKITSQSVGRIRKKLEEEIIDDYTLHLNYSKLGINIFSLGMIKLTAEGKKINKSEIENKILDNHNILKLYRCHGKENSHYFVAAFKDINELSKVLNSRDQNDVHNFTTLISCVVPVADVVKEDARALFHKAIDALGTKSAGTNYNSKNSKRYTL